MWEHSASHGPARLVLLAIADNAHDDGAQAWPSITTLVRKTRLAERTVQGALKELVKLGELDVEHNAGPRHVNLYRILMTTPAGDAPPQTMHPAGDAGVQEMHPTPAGDAPLPPQEMHPEPSVEPSRNRKPSPTDRSAIDLAPITVIPTTQTFIAAYVDAYRGRAGHDPPTTIKGQLAKQLKGLFNDGIPTDRIRAGFIAWFESGGHPSTLASFVEETGRDPRPRNHQRKQTQRDQLGHSMAVWALQEDTTDGPNRLGADGPPHGRALPAPAD